MALKGLTLPDPTLEIKLSVTLHLVVQSTAEEGFRLEFVELAAYISHALNYHLSQLTQFQGRQLLLAVDFHLFDG